MSLVGAGGVEGHQAVIAVVGEGVARPVGLEVARRVVADGVDPLGARQPVGGGVDIHRDLRRQDGLGQVGVDPVGVRRHPAVAPTVVGVGLRPEGAAAGLFGRLQAVEAVVGIALDLIEGPGPDALAQDVAVVRGRPVGVVEQQHSGSLRAQRGPRGGLACPPGRSGSAADGRCSAAAPTGRYPAADPSFLHEAHRQRRYPPLLAHTSRRVPVLAPAIRPASS